MLNYETYHDKMDLVVDANVLFAVLIKGSFSARLIFNEEFHLFTPEYVFVEIEEHQDEIISKTERTLVDFYNLLEVLKRRIVPVPLEELTEYVEEAEKITPDPDDMAYIALALKLNCAIWSNDKELKEKQSMVKVYPTHELVRL